ncbi:hypothetical protein KEM55_004965 [Ascosphaera atra]|nr:hypothetical protein KEM55_004965 [Ascosphaera atra]
MANFTATINSAVINDKETPINIAGVRGGTGPPILLLHGCPQDRSIWEPIRHELMKHFTVVAIDLRGYGQSSKPTHYTPDDATPWAGEKEHELYSDAVMAEDCKLVMDSHGLTPFYIVGHDRGARVAHQLCVRYPEAVKKAIFLDIAPTVTMYDRTDMEFAQKYFHWFFLTQPYPLPETAIARAPDVFLKRFMGDPVNPCHENSIENTAKQFSDFWSAHAMCEDYRASATVDYRMQKEDMKNGRKIKCPITVLWGKKGVLHDPAHPQRTIEDWKAVHENGDVQGKPIDCGHYIPEEAPNAVLEAVDQFFVE